MAKLEDLPIELLYSVLVYSHSPSLPLVNRHLRSLFGAAPNAVRAAYLLNSWHETYGYYSLGLAKSRFVPVLIQPKEEAQKCSIFVLDYCVRFPICNHLVLRLIEQRLLTEEMWGNIIASVDMLRHPVESGAGEDDEEGSAFGHTSSAFFPIQQLPKRLFNNLTQPSTTFPTSQQPLALLGDDDTPSGRRLSELLARFGPLGEFQHIGDLLLVLRILLVHRPLRSFMTYTSQGHLEASPCLIDSHGGYPLSKAVVFKAGALVSLLLAFGASPSSKDSLPLLVACRANWEAGVRLLVERDEETAQVWEDAVRGLRAWLSDEEDGRPHLSEKDVELAAPSASASASASAEDGADSGTASGADAPPSSSPPAPGKPNVKSKSKSRRSAKPKRRKLEDRCALTPRMLREAVQHGAMEVAHFLQKEKGVVPDIKTIQALERMLAEREREREKEKEKEKQREGEGGEEGKGKDKGKGKEAPKRRSQTAAASISASASASGSKRQKR